MAAVLAGEGPAAGPSAQGYGPLRMWPGGLCLSRAIGDFDVGASVLCAPHIMQACLLMHLLLIMHASWWRCCSAGSPKNKLSCQVDHIVSACQQEEEFPPS